MIDRLKTCRCCLEEPKNNEDLYEFSSEVAIDNESTTFIKINACYFEITNFNILLEDEDNTKICSSCLADLKFCYLFKRKCIDSAKSFDDDETDDKEIGKYSNHFQLFFNVGDNINPSLQKDHIESNNIEEEYCVVEDGQSNEILKSEHIEDPCFIEYVEEELICDNPEDIDDGEETDDGSDYKLQSKFETISTKRVKLENIEHEGITYNCDLCSKSFGNKLNRNFYILFY